MAHADYSVTINRPVKTVFDFVIDGEKNPLWRPMVADIRLVSGTAGSIGAVYKQGLKGPGGRRIDGDYEIVELKANKLMRFRVIAGPARPIGIYRFEADGNSTRFTFVLDYKPKGFAALMDGMINRTMKAEVATLDNARAYLESQ